MIELDVKKQEALPPMDIGSKYVVNMSEDKMYELGAFLQMRFKRLKGFLERSEWERDKAFCFNAYHMVPKDRPLPFPGAANLSCPFDRIGVDSFHANVMASLFADRNRMKVVPDLIQKDFASSAKKAADYMRYVMNYEADAYMAFDDADKKAQMYGVGYLEPIYIKEEIYETVDVKDKKVITELNPQTGMPETREEEVVRKEKKKRTVFDGTRIISIPIESIFLSPFMKSIEQAVREDVVFKTFTILFSDVVERSKGRDGKTALYKKSQVEKIKSQVYQKASKQLSELEQSRAAMDGFYYDLICGQEQVELAQAYLWYDVDGDDIKEEISVTFHPESGTVLRISLTKCRIIEIVPRPVDERFYGEGIPKVCRWISEEWENFHNTRSNAGQWENTTFGFYRAGGRFNPQTITIQPGRFYAVDDPREVTFAQPPRVGSSYFQEEQMLLNYFERIFALDENIQGVTSRRNRTATETLNVSSRSSIRFSNPFNRIVTQVNKLINHVWELQRECAPEDKEFYVVGSDGAWIYDKMDKYEYSAGIRFSIQVSSVFDQQLVRDTALLAYRLLLVNPFVQQHPAAMYDLTQQTIDSLGIQLTVPKPDEAKTLSPFEEHEMMQRGDYPEPKVGEDVDHHLQVHMRLLNSPSIAEWPPETVKELIIHIDKTKILKATLEAANLNQSGRFTGNPMMGQPSLTANRNPTQKFNTMKVGENTASSMQNVKNGMQQQGGSGAEQALQGIMGQGI